MGNLKELAKTMMSYSNTMGDHHYQALKVIEHTEKLKKSVEILMDAIDFIRKNSTGMNDKSKHKIDNAIIKVVEVLNEQ